MFVYAFYLSADFSIGSGNFLRNYINLSEILVNKPYSEGAERAIGTKTIK
jgi:hypothetical protein